MQLPPYVCVYFGHFFINFLFHLVCCQYFAVFEWTSRKFNINLRCSALYLFLSFFMNFPNHSSFVLVFCWFWLTTDCDTAWRCKTLCGYFYNFFFMNCRNHSCFALAICWFSLMTDSENLKGCVAIFVIFFMNFFFLYAVC